MMTEIFEHAFTAWYIYKSTILPWGLHTPLACCVFGEMIDEAAYSRPHPLPTSTVRYVNIYIVSLLASLPKSRLLENAFTAWYISLHYPSRGTFLGTSLEASYTDCLLRYRRDDWWSSPFTNCNTEFSDQPHADSTVLRFSPFRSREISDLTDIVIRTIYICHSNQVVGGGACANCLWGGRPNRCSLCKYLHMIIHFSSSLLHIVLTHMRHVDSCNSSRELKKYEDRDCYPFLTTWSWS